ncbi:ArsR/SmtB family transcription factor [Sphingomonas oligophenolica]|uniref:Transcriptional regulator n=1 Tax=Sphingomonas oligophenolica TaxID=301154 RepID=A0A502C3U0_9SPHN|nr:metalloregulator ArsR/SmtB family transcription factor [Sphingomonas oligophenolica]TPG06581.1 transcriptional regulator [Sphingomonas oligophenolica]
MDNIPSLDIFRDQAGQAVGLLKALSNQNRLLIMCYLTEAGELSVGELADKVCLGQSALSQHLAKLRDEGLVETRRQAQTIHYRVRDPKVAQVLALLHDLFCPDLGRDD